MLGAPPAFCTVAFWQTSTHHARPAQRNSVFLNRQPQGGSWVRMPEPVRAPRHALSPGQAVSGELKTKALSAAGLAGTVWYARPVRLGACAHPFQWSVASNSWALVLLRTDLCRVLPSPHYGARRKIGNYFSYSMHMCRWHFLPFRISFFKGFIYEACAVA